MPPLNSLLVLGLVAFGGGVFGAAIGGLRALGLAGIAVTVGEALAIAQEGYEPGAGTAIARGATGITADVGLGPWLGPHVAFAGGAAAAAYAARRGHLDPEFEFHPAKYVSAALGTRPDVLLVGGVFGVVGLFLATLSAGLALPWDPLAASLVASGLLHRVTFGYPVLGSIQGNPLDMSPYERGERRKPVAETGAVLASDERRYTVEPWLPDRYGWGDSVLFGLAVGLVAGFVTHTTGSPLLAFGLAASSLLLLDLGADADPLAPSHHVALVAGIAVTGVGGDTSLLTALLVGGGFGVVTGVAGEFAQRLLYAHADTHLDPPAVAIVVGTFLLAILDVLGLLTQPIIPTPV